MYPPKQSFSPNKSHVFVEAESGSIGDFCFEDNLNQSNNWI